MDKKSGMGFWLGSIAFAVAIPMAVYRIARKIWSKENEEFFRGKVVVITGASSGIGEALAHEFYKRGCKVVLCARRSQELERVKMELLQKHPTVPTHLPVVVPVDLSNLESLEGVVKQILDITGHIDFLINNGGISSRGSVLDTHNNVFMKIMAVNYFGTVALTKAVLPHMIERQQGHIVFMSSVQGLIAIPYRSVYASSKHALQAFSDSLRAEVKRYNVHVSIISPGYVRTAISLNALTGTGSVHGKMDATTEQGYNPDFVAAKTASAIVSKQEEVIIAPLLHKIVILLRTNLPKLYFIIMARRAMKEN